MPLLFLGGEEGGAPGGGVERRMERGKGED